MNSPSFEYYVNRVAEFEKAVKWYKAWDHKVKFVGMTVTKTKYGTLKSFDLSKPTKERHKKFKQKREKALERILSLE